MPVKVCTKCGQKKSLVDFHHDKKRKDNRAYWCKVCASKNSKQHHQKNKERINKRRKKRYRENKDKWRDRHLKINYGITSKQYDQMLIRQNGCCAICGKHWSEFQTRLHVDHDRKTGQVRGLLCFKCNTGLGSFDHIPDRLKQAALYLKGV